MGKTKASATGKGYLGEIMVHRISGEVGIVENVVEAHDGHVRATRAAGLRGARIELELPGFEPLGDLPPEPALQPPLRA